MKDKAKLNIPYHKQKNSYYCGPAALQMVFAYFKYRLSQQKIAREARTNARHGTKNRALIRVAVKNGFYVYAQNNSTFLKIQYFLKKGWPVIVNFIEPTDNEGHYAVVSDITPGHIVLQDPFNGKGLKIPRLEFLPRWHNKKNTQKRWLMTVAKPARLFKRKRYRIADNRTFTGE